VKLHAIVIRKMDFYYVFMQMFEQLVVLGKVTLKISPLIYSLKKATNCVT